MCCIFSQLLQWMVKQLSFGYIMQYFCVTYKQISEIYQGSFLRLICPYFFSHVSNYVYSLV